MEPLIIERTGRRMAAVQRDIAADGDIELVKPRTRRPVWQRLGADTVGAALTRMAFPIAGLGEEVAMRRDLGEGADRVQALAQLDRSTR